VPVGSGGCGSTDAPTPGSTSRSRHRSNRATYIDASIIAGNAARPTTAIASTAPPTASSVYRVTVTAPSITPDTR
jgi:hypothetical protein